MSAPESLDSRKSKILKGQDGRINTEVKRPVKAWATRSQIGPWQFANIDPLYGSTSKEITNSCLPGATVRQGPLCSMDSEAILKGKITAHQIIYIAPSE